MCDLRRMNRELGITTVVNLHFLDLARSYADRIIGMREGKVVFDGTPEAGRRQRCSRRSTAGRCEAGDVAAAAVSIEGRHGEPAAEA